MASPGTTTITINVSPQAKAMLKKLEKAGEKADAVAARFFDEGVSLEGMRKRMEEDIVTMLKSTTTPSKCSCGKTIFFLRSRTGQMVPFSTNAKRHKLECPHASRYRNR